jgi:uncharacterized LabA/DUF88 family protein
MMADSIFFIDGFNLYHSLIGTYPGKQNYKWIDLKKLCMRFLEPKDSLLDIYYFTALCIWDSNKANRHQIYISALENTGVNVIKGKFKTVTKKCRGKCKEEYQTHEEKRTDVSIGVKLFSLANDYEKAFVMSADSDLVPAIEEARKYFPDKKFICVIPVGKKAEELKSICDESRKMKEKHICSSLFDKDITLADGNLISCPVEWR